jgi:hypothetical protein
LIRYLILKVDGKFAVQQENAGVASFRDTENDAIAAARKMLDEKGVRGIEYNIRREDGTLVVWRENLVK